MRTREKRTSGLTRGTFLAAAAVGVLALVGIWGRADATAPSRAAQLATILESPAGHSRKLQVIEELRTIDTGEAHEKLQHLAASSDDAVARMAISALGRSTFDGARSCWV